MNEATKHEQYAIYMNSYLVTKEEYEDGYATINGVVTPLSRDKLKLRDRLLIPHNIIVASVFSPINNQEKDYEIEKILDDILTNKKTIPDLAKYILSLPKRSLS